LRCVNLESPHQVLKKRDGGFGVQLRPHTAGGPDWFQARRHFAQKTIGRLVGLSSYPARRWPPFTQAQTTSRLMQTRARSPRLGIKAARTITRSNHKAMPNSTHTTRPQQLVGLLQSARIGFVRAECKLEGAKREARIAKKRRKQAKLAVRRARKGVKRAKSELAQAKIALVDAETNVKQAGKHANRKRVKARPGKPAKLAAPKAISPLKPGNRRRATPIRPSRSAKVSTASQSLTTGPLSGRAKQALTLQPETPREDELVVSSAES
jgi:hypothetical protein